MIVGTAGHIDHGKTALVRALTGVDTDRLPEEKRRGITIDLGFAPLLLDDRRVGVVDVPGHEAFVRTMLAGATGIDVALLVVAADEGVMPQTREHVDILTLLDVRHGVVALTKCDLVEDDWLALVREDVRALLASTPLAASAIIATSTVTGSGLELLRSALVDALRAVPARETEDVFRMPIDRAFSVRGAGTVVTGTVWSGRVRADDTLTLLPSGRDVRVRSLQVHGTMVSEAGCGSRAAIGLAGVELAAAGRGAVLVGSAAWPTTDRMRVDVALLEDVARSLRPRERVRLHLGTSDVAARIVAAGGAIHPGELRGARAILEERIVARAGDRFVLRLPSPARTIGGGIVRDPLPPFRRVRPWPPSRTAPGERLTALLEESGPAGLDVATLPVRLGVAPSALGGLLAAHEAYTVAGRAYMRGILERAAEHLAAAVREWLAAHPLERGVQQSLLRGRLGHGDAAFDEILRRARARGSVELRDGLVIPPGWSPQLDAQHETTRVALLSELAAAAREPPGTSELVTKHGQQVISLLRILERERLVVSVEPHGGRYYSADVVDGLVRDLQRAMADGTEFSPAALREVLGMSRKFLIPFLEFCDRVGITERRPGGRVLGAGGDWPPAAGPAVP